MFQKVDLSRLFNFEGTLKRYGGLAQLGEHLLCKQGVKGSIPLISTNRAKSSGKGTNEYGRIAQVVRAHA